MAETQYNPEGIHRFAYGSIDPTATGSKAITLGWTPRHVKVVNEDLVVVWEKFSGMADTTAIKTVTAGTTTIDTNSGIVIDDGGFTISSAAYGDGDNLHWAAWG